MADKGDLGVSPYSKVSLDIDVKVASDVPMPLHFVNDRTSGLFQPAPNTVGVGAGGIEAVRCTANGIQVQSQVAPPAGGAATSGITVSNTTSGGAGLGLFWGSGAPAFTAAQGSWYMRSDGVTTGTRGYIATSTPGTWTGMTTAG